jgi:hypothetical protein
MKKSSEYDRHAQECRALAAQMKTGEQREQLLQLAETWMRLAQDRSDLVRKHPKLEQAPEHARQE